MTNGAGLADLLNTFLLAAAGAALVLGLVVVLLWRQDRQTGRRQAEIERQAGELGSLLAEVQSGLEALRQEAQAFPGDDPPPYQPAAHDLREMLDRLQAQQTELAGQFEQLATRRPQTPADSPRPDGFMKPVSSVYGLAAWLWFDLWAGPRFWEQRRQAFEELQEAARALRARLTDAGGLLQSLRETPLQVAERAREMRQAVERMLHLELALRNFEVYGQELDAAANEARQFNSVLETLPAYFFEPAEETIRQRAGKPETIAAWQTLVSLARPVGDGLARFEGWQRDYLAIRQQVEQMRQRLREAAAALALLAPAADLDHWLAELREASDLRQKLEKVYPALAVETLAEFADLTSQVSDTANRLARRAVEARQAIEDLNELIPSLETALARLEPAMRDLAAQPAYPVGWGQAQVELERLLAGLAELGPVGRRRDPERLPGQAAQAKQLAQIARGLERQVQQVREQREALLPLLTRPELDSRPAWLNQAKTLHQQTKPYAETNWSPSQAVAKLEDEAKKLLRRREQWLPRQAKSALLAADMAERLQAVTRLAEELELFQKRLQAVAETVAQIQQQEEQALAQLAAGRPALERLAERLAEARPVLAGEADRRRRQVEKLAGRGGQLVKALKRRRAGPAAAKAERTAAWLEESYRELAGLLPLLTGEVRRLDAELHQLVARLPAPQEGQETALQELRQLLAVNRFLDGPPLPPAAEGDPQRLTHLAGLVEARLEDRENLGRLLRSLS